MTEPTAPLDSSAVDRLRHDMARAIGLIPIGSIPTESFRDMVKIIGGMPYHQHAGYFEHVAKLMADFLDSQCARP